jgi:transposase-like protein
MPNNKYTDEQKDQVIELYRAGVKGDEISRRTGVPRPTVYLLLEQRGIKPGRRKVMESRQMDTMQLMEQLSERDRLIGRLQHEIEQLKQRLGIEDARNGTSEPWSPMM